MIRGGDSKFNRSFIRKMIVAGYQLCALFGQLSAKKVRWPNSFTDMMSPSGGMPSYEMEKVRTSADFTGALMNYMLRICTKPGFFFSFSNMGSRSIPLTPAFF